jgi:DNA-binding NtrC family response regulator
MMEKRTVLFVDDDEKVLASLKRSAIDESYETIFASSGKEALEILQQQAVHVIVADVRMPEMSGPELLEIVENEYPHIIGIVLSGQRNMTQEEISTLITGVNQGKFYRFVAKPWNFEHELKGTVRQAIECYERQNEPGSPVGELK